MVKKPGVPPPAPAAPAPAAPVVPAAAAAGTPPPTKPCSSCGVAIAATAKVCHNCKSSQQPWREELKYWGGLTGLATLIVSGIAFSATFILAAFRLLFLPDIAVTEIDGQGDSVIWNQSGRKIWVETFNAKSDKPFFDLKLQVHQAITEVETPHSFSFSQLAGCQWQGQNGDLFDGRGVGDYVVNLPSDQFEARINQPQIDPRYLPVILFKEGSEYKQLAAAKIGISEVPFTCSFSYTRLDTGSKHERPVACVGVLKDHTPGPRWATGVCNPAAKPP